jgi:hypothetical protein
MPVAIPPLWVFVISKTMYGCLLGINAIAIEAVNPYVA